MKKLKRNECAVLPLVLKGKWYDMIASGEKKEEYRDAKLYWQKRIANKAYIANDKPIVVAFSRGYKKQDMFYVVDSIPYRTFMIMSVKKFNSLYPEFKGGAK